MVKQSGPKNARIKQIANYRGQFADGIPWAIDAWALPDNDETIHPSDITAHCQSSISTILRTEYDEGKRGLINLLFNHAPTHLIRIARGRDSEGMSVVRPGFLFHHQLRILPSDVYPDIDDGCKAIARFCDFLMTGNKEHRTSNWPFASLDIHRREMVTMFWATAIIQKYISMHKKRAPFD